MIANILIGCSIALSAESFVVETYHHRFKSAQNAVSEGSINRRTALIGTLATAPALHFFSPSICNASLNSETADKIPTWMLDNYVRFPTLALNTVGLSADETELAIELSMKQDISHIDFHPGKERDGVARYLTNRNVNRESLFLNTKIRKAPPGTSPNDAAESTRQQIDDDLMVLGVDCVDMLMLRDNPDPDVIQAQWVVMEEALAAKKTRSIGVINFCEKALSCVLQTAKIKPAINYYMLHIGMGKDAHGLRSFGESRGIRTFAYGAIGEPGPNQELLTNPTVKSIGFEHGKSPEEVALRWVTQSGAAVSVRPTINFGLGTGTCKGNLCEEGIKARARSFGWTLSQNEMEKLNSLSSPDDNPTLFSSAGCPGAFVMPK